MAYKVQYTTISPEKYFCVKRGLLKKYWKKAVGAAIIVALVIGTKKLFIDNLLSSNAEASDATMDHLVQAIVNGDDLYDAVSTFCLEVIENGR